MAKLYFNYAAMNAGKSTILLQASHNYIERGMSTLLLTSRLDDRSGKKGTITSRIGISADAELFSGDDDLLSMVSEKHAQSEINAVLVDEAQFLSRKQVWALACIADDLEIPVMCYGLRTDFQGKLFPGSAELLAIADELREIKTVCWCGKKATMVIRLDAGGQPIEEGDQIEIGGDDKYISLCRKHWRERDMEAAS
jgi:thymidine kinase